MPSRLHSDSPHSLPSFAITAASGLPPAVIEQASGVPAPSAGDDKTQPVAARTAQLPKIAFDTPKRLIGTNTVDCLKSGIMFSTACSIDGMIERIEEELGQKCTVIATGGLASLIMPLCKREIILDEDLMLKGLINLYKKNCDK